ncbi:DUF6625 family protein [Selenomonas sp. ND2010]|uniref:DUF6625 family protein n=1 Tax=Selenomonas sp. ND2010 TaxID=1410618 RepID=UPI00051BDA72|nr:DUF6625 family protein [Selenomonas sp. ND2010]
MANKTINIIIPYFGNFPNYYQLFLDSCACNSTIDWTIISDNDAEYDFPPNVKRVKMSFADVKRLIDNKFNFKATVNSVHKLCEYKPAYGYIFNDIVRGYDYWGYGDLDLIYGDMRSFLTDDILSYDKVFTLGHLSLIRNTDELNRLFMKNINDKQLYKEAFLSDSNFNFDEEFMGKDNINTIFRKYGYSVWDKSFAADIYTKSNGFKLDLGDGKIENIKDSLFIWNNGQLVRFFAKGKEIKREYFLYIHLQKRKMNVRVNHSKTVYKIIPNVFDDLEVDFDSVEEDFSNIKKKKFNNQYISIRYRNLKDKVKNYIKVKR